MPDGTPTKPSVPIKPVPINSRATLQAVVEFSKNTFFSSNQGNVEEKEAIDTSALVIQIATFSQVHFHERFLKESDSA